MYAVDELFVVRPDGLQLATLANFEGDHSLHKLSYIEPSAMVEASRMPDDLEVTNSAIQYELVDDGRGYKLLSDRPHTSLGVGTEDTYRPLVTLLDYNHPVMQLQEQQK